MACRACRHVTDLVMRQPGGFVPFGPDHQAVLLLTAIACLALLLSRRRLQGRDDRWLRWGIAAVLAGNALIEWTVSAVQGQVRIPLQLCDLALVITAWALVSLRRSVVEVAYFLALAGSVQAVLTPDLRVPFPTYRWMTFFLNHCGVVFSAVYMALTGRVQPTARSVWRVWLLTNVYAAGVGLLNWRFGANYGYLAHKPSHPSLLDYFGPWPYYIGMMDVMALLSFSLCYAPFAFVLRRRSGRTP